MLGKYINIEEAPNKAKHLVILSEVLISIKFTYVYL
jgi:hypothetical protein